jgi:peroxiredoxin
MVQLRRNKNSFAKAGAQVVLVGMGTPSESAEFAAKFNIPFPIVADPQNKLYRKFELKQMSTFSVTSQATRPTTPIPKPFSPPSSNTLLAYR